MIDIAKWEDTPVRVAGLMRDSIVDGEGLRFSVFAQGCPHHCPGCHNPQTWDRRGGSEMTLGQIITAIGDDELVDGVTFSGGEPFEQAEEMATIAAWCHERGLNVWCYTGWTYEEIKKRGLPAELELLRETDVLVDGRFIRTEKTLSLPWRGSKNQRLLRLGHGLVMEVE